MNTDHHHLPKVYRGDAKKEGETDDQHAKRVAYNAKSRAYAKKQAELRKENLAIKNTVRVEEGKAPVKPSNKSMNVQWSESTKTIPSAPIRGYAFGDEKEEATEVLPLPPPINVVVATPPAPPATLMESVLPKYRKRIEELEAILRIKDMVLVHHIKEISTKDFIIKRLEECLRMRETS